METPTFEDLVALLEAEDRNDNTPRQKELTAALDALDKEIANA